MNLYHNYTHGIPKEIFFKTIKNHKSYFSKNIIIDKSIKYLYIYFFLYVLIRNYRIYNSIYNKHM